TEALAFLDVDLLYDAGETGAHLELADALAQALDLAARAVDLRLRLPVLRFERHRIALELRLQEVDASACLILAVDGALQIELRRRAGGVERTLRVRVDRRFLELPLRIGQL